MRRQKRYSTRHGNCPTSRRSESVFESSATKKENDGYTIKINDPTRSNSFRGRKLHPRRYRYVYFGKTVQDGGFGKLRHRRQMAEIDKQDDGRGSVELEHEPAVIDRIE